MASRTTTDPIDILLEMGVDLDNLSEEEDYLSALMEAANTLTIKDATDPRIAPLQQEILKLRKKRFSEARKTKNIDPKKLENPETIWSNIKYDGPQAKKTTIKPDAFFNKKSEEVRDNVRTGAIDSKKLKFSSVNIAPKQKALPTSAIVPYEEPVAEEVKEKKKEEPRNLLAEIAASVTNIADTLKNQYNLKKKEGEFDRKKAQRDKRKLDEKNLEKGFGTLLKSAQKIIKPVQGFFDKIFNFIKWILIGKFLMGLIDWISNPDNRKKLFNIIEFLGKHWKKLLSLYLVFGTGLGKFVFSLTKLLIGGAIKLTVAVAKLLAAKKLVGGLGARKFARFLGGGKGKLLTAGLTTALTVGGAYAATNALTGGGGEQQTQGFSGGGLAQPKIQPTPQAVKKDSPKGMSSAMKGAALGSMFGPLGAVAGAGIGSLFDKFGKKKDDTVTLSKPANVELEVPSGTEGEVDGPGGTDKVPAMLTAGEFVMSRGAVQKFGVQTLEGMNAAGGGTNQPKVINNKVFAYGGGFVGFDGKVPNTANVGADQRGQSSLGEWSKMSREDKHNVLNKYRERQQKSVNARYRYLADMQSKGLDAYGRPINMINSPSVNTRDISNIEVPSGQGGPEPKGGFNLLNPFSWFSGQSQEAVDSKETGAYSDDSLSGRLLNRRNATNEAIRKMRGQGGPFLPSFDEVINYGVKGQREVEERLANLVRQGEELIPRLEQGIVGLAMGAQEVARQTQVNLENAAVGAYRQSEQFAVGLANAGQQVANDVVNYYESGDMQRQLERTGRGIFDTTMSAGESLKEGATSAVAGTFDGLSAVASSEPYTKMTEITAKVNDNNIRAMDGLVDSLPEGSPMQDMVDKGLIPIPTSSPGMMRNMTFVKALLGPLGMPFKIMSNPEVDRMRQLTIDKTLEKSGLVMGKDGEVKMNWNQEDINKGRAGGGAYTDDLGPGGKAFNSILGRFTASTKDGGNVLYTDDRYNFNKSTAEYLQNAKDQMLSGAFGEAAYFGAAALGKFAEDLGWLNQRALGSRIAVGEVDRDDKRITGSAKPTTARPNVAAAVKKFEGGNYDAATKALGGDPSKPEPIPQLTAPAPQPGKPKREWYDPRGWIGMQYGGEVNGSLKMGRNVPKISAPGAPIQAKVTVIKAPSKRSTGGTRPAPRGGSRTPQFNAGSGSSSKRKILGIF